MSAQHQRQVRPPRSNIRLRQGCAHACLAGISPCRSALARDGHSLQSPSRALGPPCKAPRARARSYRTATAVRPSRQRNIGGSLAATNAARTEIREDCALHASPAVSPVGARSRAMGISCKALRVRWGPPSKPLARKRAPTEQPRPSAGRVSPASATGRPRPGPRAPRSGHVDAARAGDGPGQGLADAAARPLTRPACGGAAGDAERE